MDMQQFIKDRDEALLSLDKEKILSYAKKYGAKVPHSKKAFWGGVHKAICQLSSASPVQIEYSENWLLKNGFRIEIK